MALTAPARSDNGPTPADPSLETLLSGQPPPAAASRRGRAPWMVAAAVAAAIAVLASAYEYLLTPIMEQQRQHHLASDFAVPRPVLRWGDAVAVIQIPVIGVNVMAIEGDSIGNLRSGPAHRVGSALPGQQGNAIFFGHRSRYGGPFGDLASLKANDQIFVKGRGSAPTTLYRVTSVARVDDSDRAALAPSDDRRLTLVTSVGGAIPHRRLVVVATADPASSPAATGGYNQTSFDSARGSPVFNLGMVVAYIAAVAAWAAWTYLRRRHRPAVALAVVAPIGLLVLFLVLYDLDRILPSTL